MAVSRGRLCAAGVDADEVVPQREDLVQRGAELPDQRTCAIALS